MLASSKPINLEGKQQESFSLLTHEGQVITDSSYTGEWQLLVFHRHLG